MKRLYLSNIVAGTSPAKARPQRRHLHPRRLRQRGIALMLVLWASAVLALLLAQMVADTRVASRAARLRLDTTRAELAAQGGMAIAIAGLNAQGRQRWAADGRTYRMPLLGSSSDAADVGNATRATDAIDLAIQAWSEKGKVDLNTSDAPTLRRLFACAGADPSQASRLATAILASRISNAGTLIQTPDALQQMSGMPEALFEAVSDATTVWSGNPIPESDLASPLALCASTPLSPPDASANVRQHWQRAATALGDPGPVIDIVSEARLSNGVSARVSAVVMLRSGDDTSSSSLPSSVPYNILDWHAS